MAAELGAELKAITAELRRVQVLLPTAPPKTPKVARESVEQRVVRMREWLAEGGELAQGVVREIFSAGIWLYADPEGGGFLRAYAQTALAHPRGLIDAEGHAMAEGFPRLYNVVAGESRTSLKRVAGSGSGGVICILHTFDFIDVQLR